LTETLKKLITILKDGEFHSGEQLGKTLGVTRSAVWKLIKQLSTWDLEIESVTNKGYRIPGGLTLLSKEKILSFLSFDQQARLEKIEILDNIPSTNDYLLHSLQARPNKNYACFAEKQTHGKGRRGRTWIAPFAKNIYLSVLWRFPQDPSALSGLSLAIAVSIIETLKHYTTTQELGIKWPNDVLYKNHKLAGILVELAGESNDNCSAVIGVGLNVDMPNASHQYITQPWADLQNMTQTIVDRNEVAGLLLSHLVNTLILFQNQGFHAFTEKWQTLDLTLGKPISLTNSASEKLQGIGRGINEQGHFLLETPCGIKSFSSGEVSIRLSN